MFLHCKICSLNGTHISEDSAIATIDRAKLKLPLAPEAFTSINPERHIPDPWLPGVDWQTMICPRGNHLPWGIDYKDIAQAMRYGGPKQILTDEGLIDVEQVETTEESVINPNLRVFTCEKCGRQVRSRLAFANHQKACKGKTEDA